MRHLAALACVSILLTTIVPFAARGGPEFGPNVLENRQRIAAAMLGALSGSPGRSVEAGAGFADIDLDGYWEIVVDGGKCADCASAIFSLREGRYADLLADGVSERSVPVKVLEETTKGYRDLQLGSRPFAWDGQRYVDVSTRPVALDMDGFVSACRAVGEYSYYADGEDAGAASGSMCACVGERIAAMGFAQSDLDGYRKLLEAKKPDEGVDTSSLGELDKELSMIESGCSVRNGYSAMLPVAPQMYATYTENYGELVGNSYYSGDPLNPENALAYDGLIRACASNEEVRNSRQISTPDRALGVCGCLAERLSMARASQRHIDAVAGLYDYSVTEEAVDKVEDSLVEFTDREASWCTRRLAALIDHRWPEHPE